MTPRVLLVLTALGIIGGCIRPQNYHMRGGICPPVPNPGAPAGSAASPPPDCSIHQYHYSSTDRRYGRGYFRDASAYEAYVEFDARGSTYGDAQLQAAIDLITAVRYSNGSASSRKVAVYIFVHGWKNNASESSGNVWGFRRFLSDVAARQCDNTPVIGVYVGWPGASLRNDLFLSFWNREPIADTVGQSDEWTTALDKLLHAAKDADKPEVKDNGKLDTKGHNYDTTDGSTAVVIGHSFGGIVLEHAATALLNRQVFDKGDLDHLPADLFILVNEAGAAEIGRRFRDKLVAQKLAYVDGNKVAHPLLLSMTSVGDVATKIAYPGAEVLSFNRNATEPITPTDAFGQTNTFTYNVVTAANMLPLQSHEIVPFDGKKTCTIPIPPGNPAYCMNRLIDVPNTTPYWIMQMPQVFVPDHSAVFQDYLLTLIGSIMQHSGIVNCVPSHTGITPPNQKRPLAPPPQLIQQVTQPETRPARPHLERTK